MAAMVYWPFFKCIPCSIGDDRDSHSYTILLMFGPQIISANDYSLRLFQLVLVVAFIPLVTPFYTLLSETSLASNIPDMWSRFYRVTKYIFILFLVVITIIFFSSEWLIRLAFERGEFDATSTYITSQLFLYYCVGLFFEVMRQIFYRMYFIYSKIRYFIFESIVSTIIYIGLLMVMLRMFDSFIVIPVVRVMVVGIFAAFGYVYLKRVLKDS